MCARGRFLPENGHTLNPLRLVQTLAEMLQAEGGQVLRRKAVSFGLNGTAARHLQCLGGNIEADVFVVAAGIASADFARPLGDRVPLQAERGYHVMLPQPAIRPRIKISNRDYMFGLTPMAHGVRIAGHVATARPDDLTAEREARARLADAQR